MSTMYQALGCDTTVAKTGWHGAFSHEAYTIVREEGNRW